MHSSTARRWAALIDQADRSGLTRREFAAKAGVNPNTLSWWRWKLKRGPSGAVTTRFLEVVEVEEPPPSPTIRLELRDTVIIEVDDDTDLDLLRDVMDALC